MSDPTILIRISNPYPVLHEALVSLNPGQDVQIGRSEDNDVVVLNNYVSRHHILLFWKGGRTYVRDLKSMNGTKLNGKQLKSDVPVRPGDEITLSNVKITLLPGLGKTKELTPDTVEQLKDDTLKRTRRSSPFPEQSIQSTLTLVSDAPTQGKSFVQPDSQRATLWRDEQSAEIVRTVRQRQNWTIPLIALGLLVFLALLLW